MSISLAALMKKNSPLPRAYGRVPYVNLTTGFSVSVILDFQYNISKLG